MAEEDDAANGSPEPEFRRSKLLSVTVGPDDEDDLSIDDDFSDPRFAQLQAAMHQACLDEDNAPFVTDDMALAVPSTSNAGSTHLMGGNEIDMTNALNEVFASGNRLFQPIQDSNFVEEIFVEKPPKFVGDYLFGDQIGEGSYGKVKEGLHRHTLLRVAIKIIKDKKLRKIPGGEANVQNEIKLLQKVHHPNVIQLIECFRVDEKQKLYMIFDFCVISLQQLLDCSSGQKLPIRANEYSFDQKRLPEFQAHLYFKQLLAGLDHIHERGIVHKDIKPGNLLLALDGCLKICDMGVAEELEFEKNGDWCTLAQGTPKFQPPEVVSGNNEKFRGFPFDIWASGITLYNIVSGSYPFDGDAILKLFENICHLPVEMPKDVAISKDLKELLYGLLEKDPEKRWNMEKIMGCSWIKKEHEVDPLKIVPVPNGHESSLDRVLEQLFEDRMSPVLDPSVEIQAEDRVEVRTSLIPANQGQPPTEPFIKPKKPKKKLKNGSVEDGQQSTSGSTSKKKHRLLFSCFKSHSNDSP